MALPEIACAKYVPGEGRRCAHYADPVCLRHDEFVCIAWLRANGYLRDPLEAAREHLTQLRATSPPPAAPAPPQPATVQLGLFPRLRPPRKP